MTNYQRLLNLALLPLIVLIAFLVVKHMIASKPERVAKTPPVVIPGVSIIESTAHSITPSITTYGNTRSYYQAQLSAQVSGEIINIAPSFNAGQVVKKGERLLEIDPADYLAVIAQRKASLATAEQALAEEMIRSELAAKDWTESGRKLEDATELTLRKPQLGAAKANVDSAQANLDIAKLDLSRTNIVAPYDAIVQSRTASPGNVVNSGSQLGVLIAKERAEVRLPLTPDQVKRIELPLRNQTENNSELIAIITTPSQPDTSWTATITRTEPSVDTQNQVIYVIGEIEAPFEDPNAFLPIGAFVDARIEVSTIDAVHLIPNTALIEDHFVWIVNGENLLKKQAVTRLLADGDDLIVQIDLPKESVVKIATRPLASFREDQTVKPISATK